MENTFFYFFATNWILKKNKEFGNKFTKLYIKSYKLIKFWFVSQENKRKDKIKLYKKVSALLFEINYRKIIFRFKNEEEHFFLLVLKNKKTWFELGRVWVPMRPRAGDSGGSRNFLEVGH